MNSENTQVVATSSPIPPGQTLKMLAGDPRTTNLLLGILVLCMSGLMPEQFNTLCS